ncbi:MAG: polymerase subunit sigma-70 [Caulobacter sp.]|nr:polymerase subunit sigma-70 [Caulobacter sp.]
MAEINLSSRFESERGRLRGVAYRMLGSLPEAEDAVQEAWLRLSRSDTGDVANLSAWLTTVTARVCLDMLRSRKARREEALDAHAPEDIDSGETNAEQEMILADAVGLAMLVVLEALAPAERVAFVLHDMFDLPFDEIAPIVGRTEPATRQLASRARRRVRGRPAMPDADLGRQKAVVDAFLTASRGGDMTALLAVLDPDVVFRADAAAVLGGDPPEMRGSAAVARFFSGKAGAARPALVDGALGAVVAPMGKLLLALAMRIEGGRIVELNIIADPERLSGIDFAMP